MRILVILQRNYGRRIVRNVRLRAPESWQIKTWEAPSSLPPIIEEPAEFLPGSLPPADLLVSLGQSAGVGELIPGVVKLSQAKAVVFPSDNPDWLPPGLKNQIEKELRTFGVSCSFPSPFCSLTEKSSENEYIKSFASCFGKPEISLSCSQDEITKVAVHREAPCGCTRFIAEKLVGAKVDEAEKKAGLFHHYYPCLASGRMNDRFKNSLLHHSADMIKVIVKKALATCKKEQ